MKQLSQLFVSVCCAFWLTIAYAEPAANNTIAEATQLVADDVADAAEDQTEVRRKQIMQEAVHALEHSRGALEALQEERVDDALAALALTTGKLELIVAREPQLALAPTGVSVATNDVYGSPEAIKKAIREAQRALDDGAVQKARRQLSGLGSEIVITVSNLPLATYPDAIKALTPLIDDGKLKEAASALEDALSTLVLTHHVVPLPVMRSKALLDRAEELTAIDERSEEQRAELQTALDGARTHLQLAELLGYGSRRDHKDILAQIKLIEKKTKNGESGPKIFTELKVSLTNLWTRVVG